MTDRFKECRHCGWLCAPNNDATRSWYPLEQEAAPSHGMSSNAMERLRAAADEMIKHQLTGSREGMNALQELADAALAASGKGAGE